MKSLFESFASQKELLYDYMDIINVLCNVLQIDNYRKVNDIVTPQ